MSEHKRQNFGPTARSVLLGGADREVPGLSAEMWGAVRMRLQILAACEMTLMRTGEPGSEERFAEAAEVAGLTPEAFAHAAATFACDWTSEIRRWLACDDEAAPLRSALEHGRRYRDATNKTPWHPRVVADAIEFAIGHMTGEIEASPE